MTHNPYPSYPGGSPEPEPQRVAPASVLNAVKLMYLGAALGAVSLVVGVLSGHAIRSAIEKAQPHASAATINTGVGVSVAFLVVGDLIAVALWLWMAWANKGGRRWARIVSSVLFAIDTLGAADGFARPGLAVSKVLGVAIWAVGLAAVVLLWRASSSSYFNAPRS